MFTVKQLSKMAGVTPRTLHHYDDIGLLKPSRIGENGYRYYGEESLLKLQQILFYRELDFPLEEIRKIMGRRDFDLLGALQSHRGALQKKAARLDQLLVTVDNTIQHIKGEKLMSQKGLFEGFSEEEQEKLALEAEQLYDPETVREANRKWKGYSAAKKEAVMAEGKAVYVDMIAAMPKGASSAEVQRIVERWRQHMDYFWTPNLDQLLGLANGYNDDPRFKANFDKMHPRLAQVELEQSLAAGYVGLKSPLAYQRSLDYARTPRYQAEEQFAGLLEQAHFPDWLEAHVHVGKAFQDYMMHHVLRLANQRGLTFQFHTGLQNGLGNLIANSNPELLSPLFLQYPEVRFDLFHIGYPYQHVLSALAKNYANVYIDLCWAHIISPEASVRAMVEWVDSVPLSKISAFGGDYSFVDAVYGHQQLARENVSKALALKVDEGLFDVDKAREIARLWFYENPCRIFQLSGKL